jgi:hypothetical protein
MRVRESVSESERERESVCVRERERERERETERETERERERERERDYTTFIQEHRCRNKIRGSLDILLTTTRQSDRLIFIAITVQRSSI